MSNNKVAAHTGAARFGTSRDVRLWSWVLQSVVFLWQYDASRHVVGVCYQRKVGITTHHAPEVHFDRGPRCQPYSQRSFQGKLFVSKSHLG